MTYSEAFNELVSDGRTVRRLLEGSSFHADDFGLWRDSRQFLARLFDRGGSVLDLGCGNGFLLRCLQEWSGRRLVPYGVDRDESFIREARAQFPGQQDHFLTFDVRELAPGSPFPGLPPRFDYVYWCVWDNCSFERPEEVEMFLNLDALVRGGGRLIMGFYHPNRWDDYAAVGRLEQLGHSFTGFTENQRGEGLAVWRDKSDPAQP